MYTCVLEYLSYYPHPVGPTGTSPTTKLKIIRNEETDGKIHIIEEEEDYSGYTILYFGFAHCPDICPSELRKLSKVLESLEKKGESETLSVANRLYLSSLTSKVRLHIAGIDCKGLFDSIVAEHREISAIRVYLLCVLRPGLGRSEVR